MTTHASFDVESKIVGPTPWPAECAVPASATLPELLDHQAAQTPDAPALVAGTTRLTYRELAGRAHSFAFALAELGVDERSRVAVVGPNTHEWMVAVFGALRLGARVDAFNTWVRAWDLDHLLGASEVDVIITVPSVRNSDLLGEFATLLPELWNAFGPGLVTSERFPAFRHLIVIGEETAGTSIPPAAHSFAQMVAAHSEEPASTCRAQPELPAMVLYTSGSTQNPKAVPLEHRAMIENAYAIGLRMGIGRSDRIWLGSPLFWSFGIANAAMVAMTHGACLVLQEAFSPSTAAKLMAAEKCTAAYLLPSIADALASEAGAAIRAIPSLRTGLTIGRADEVQRIVTDLDVREVCNIYGSTETYGNCCVTHHDDPLDVRLTTQGPPLPGVALRIVDMTTGETLGPNTPGELQVRGRVTTGYIGNPSANAEAFTPDGWYRTGDTATVTDRGYLQFQSRHTDMIKTSGINVSPAEVESYISTHPKVSEVVVVGAEHPSRGEVVVAFVVAHTGEELSGAEIREFCRSGMASYKAPWTVEIVGSIPRTGTGKLVRKDLREPAAHAVSTAMNTGATTQHSEGDNTDDH